MNFLIWCVVLAIMLFIGGMILNIFFVAIIGIISGIATLFQWLWSKLIKQGE